MLAITINKGHVTFLLQDFNLNCHVITIMSCTIVFYNNGLHIVPSVVLISTSLQCSDEAVPLQ